MLGNDGGIVCKHMLATIVYSYRDARDTRYAAQECCVFLELPASVQAMGLVSPTTRVRV